MEKHKDRKQEHKLHTRNDSNSEFWSDLEIKQEVRVSLWTGHDIIFGYIDFALY